MRVSSSPRMPSNPDAHTLRLADDLIELARQTAGLIDKLFQRPMTFLRRPLISCCWLSRHWVK